MSRVKEIFFWLKMFFANLPMFAKNIFQNYTAKPIDVTSTPDPDNPTKKVQSTIPSFAVKRGKKNEPFTRKEIADYFEKKPKTMLVTRSVAAITPNGVLFVPNRQERRKMFRSKDPEIVKMREEYLAAVQLDLGKRLKKQMESNKNGATAIYQEFNQDLTKKVQVTEQRPH